MLEISVDLPALGRPTSPTSARSLSSSLSLSSIPGIPGWECLGARLVEVANLLLPLPPLPPLARINSSSIFVKSAIISLVSMSETMVPGGRIMVQSEPFLPCFCLPRPGAPFFALSNFWRR